MATLPDKSSPMLGSVVLALSIFVASPASAQSSSTVDKTQGDQVRIKVDNSSDVIVSAIRLRGGGDVVAKDTTNFATGGTRSAKWNVIKNPEIKALDTWLDIIVGVDAQQCAKPVKFTVDGDQITQMTLPDGTVIADEVDNAVDQIFRVDMKLGGAWGTGLNCGYRGYKVYNR